jgi:hypothetical protein
LVIRIIGACILCLNKYFDLSFQWRGVLNLLMEVESLVAGELKKMLAESTGLYPQDQKLIFKNKERDSKAYLDAARVKDGSKIVLVEDIESRERRCLEMLKNAKVEKASKSLAEISLEVDKLAGQVSFHIIKNNIELIHRGIGLRV